MGEDTIELIVPFEENCKYAESSLMGMSEWVHGHLTRWNLILKTRSYVVNIKRVGAADDTNILIPP